MHIAKQIHLRQVCATAALVGLAFFPLITHASGFDERGGMIIAGSGLGLIAGFISTFFLKISTAGKWLALLPMIAVGGGFGGGIGNAVGTGIQESSNRSYLQFEAALSESKLKQLACQDDEAMVVCHIQSNQITETSPILISINERCFGTGNSSKTEAFALIAGELHKRRLKSTPASTYSSVQRGRNWWVESKDLDYYCLLVARLHSSFKTNYLQALREKNLPLFCTGPNDGSWALGLNVNLAQTQATRGEEIWNYIQFIKANGVNFKLPIPPATPAMIDLVVQCGEPRLLAFALDYGTLPTDNNIASTTREWAERKAHPEWRCPLTQYTSPIELAEIERISLRLTATSVANAPAEKK
jgi:hypothetical protein